MLKQYRENDVLSGCSAFSESMGRVCRIPRLAQVASPEHVFIEIDIVSREIHEKKTRYL